MRDLTEQEIEMALDDNGESEEGAIAVETTVGELSQVGAGTVCGRVGNKAWEALAERFGNRRVRGWHYRDDRDIAGNNMTGMIHIEAMKKESWSISSLAEEEDGVLRPNGKSLWPGFFEFENE